MYRLVSLSTNIEHVVLQLKRETNQLETIRRSNFTYTYSQDEVIIAAETATRCRYGNALVIFNGALLFGVMVT